MGKLTDDMTRLADEILTMDVARNNFIKGIQNAVKQEADETRQLITNFRSDMNSAHEAFFGRKATRKR
jgi:cellobiose-specific phosphotransferase system component IIA